MNLKNKKILVTGADGFIGSHLVERLVYLGFDVRAFVFYNSFNSWGWLDSLPDKILSQIEIISGDIRDPSIVSTACKGCDLVFHLAALIAIPFSYSSPDSYIDTNIKGTLNILQGARQQQVSKLLVTSTSEVYGTAKYVPIDERHPLQPQSPYSASKIGADSLTESFYRSFDLPVTIVRPFNTFGPRQSARAIIPTVITQLLSGEKSIKIGDGSPTRDFNYVADVVDGFIKLAESDKTNGEIINISTNEEHKISNVVKDLIQRINPSADFINESERMRPNNSEVFRLLGDNKKIMGLTDWSPKHTLSMGLDLTIEWFKNPSNLEKYKSHLYNI